MILQWWKILCKALYGIKYAPRAQLPTRVRNPRIPSGLSPLNPKHKSNAREWKQKVSMRPSILGLLNAVNEGDEIKEYTQGRRRTGRRLMAGTRQRSLAPGEDAKRVGEWHSPAQHDVTKTKKGRRAGIQWFNDNLPSWMHARNERNSQRRVPGGTNWFAMLQWRRQGSAWIYVYTAQLIDQRLVQN